MCGIAGVLVSVSSATNLELTSIVRRMVDTIGHRGPDDSGVIAKHGVALGHARLSIIDLSSAGHQPMSTEDGQVSVVFNGEIYNFKELRAELVRMGFRFKSHTDTEVILNGYCIWGNELFSRLRGMFAIALWDNRCQELVLARDRIGKKPLFYAWHDGVLLFGSEIKALLAWPDFSRKPNLEAIHHYLSFQYVPAPWSAFQGVKKVSQASYMVVTREGKVRVERYWTLPSPQGARQRPLNELCEELIALLNESVRLRMTCDVPLGAFLSGGVDSSAVVAMMARHSSRPIKTFCIGFNEREYDERLYARLVAQRYDTDHQEMVVQPDVKDVLPKLAWHYNEPFADSSAIPTWYVSKIARKQVTAILNGDGGDESFLGYHRYSRCRQTEWVGRIPRPLRKLSTRLANAIPVCLESYRIPRTVRRLLNTISDKDSRRYAPSMAYFLEQDKKAGYDENLLPYLSSSSLDLLEQYFAESKSYVEGAARADIHTYLPDDLLVKVDIASMAHGLEARSPFLDHTLMEWAARITPDQKISNGETKSILKSAMEPYLPEAVIRRPKMGFGVPIDHWFKKELKDFAYDILLSRPARERGLIKHQFVRDMLDQHCAGIRSHQTRLWALLMLELWFQTWIDPVDPLLASPDWGYGSR